MQGIVALLVLSLCAITVDTNSKNNCDKIFRSYSGGKKSGVFQSPGYPSHYPKNVSCKFKFLALSNERVKIRFTSFALRGRRPHCKNDSVSIYSQLEREMDADDLLEAKLTGPFCGEDDDALPGLVLSTNNVLVIYFYSDNNKKTNTGFSGTYDFMDAIDDDMGTAAPSSCGYTVKSENKKSGFLVSPTYPGVYQNDLFCFYILQGRKGERIKITFMDFNLFYGEKYCPFDFLHIYDGNTTASEVIGKFCGSYNRSTVIFSTGNALRMDFVTGKNRLNFKANAQEQDADFKFARRGFNITYEFSDRFVKLDDQYVKDGSTHVRGTECDLRILSGKETNGTFVSPNYPQKFPGDIICRYYLDGLQDEQHLEKVKVEFYDFNIPGNMPYCLLGYLGENDDSIEGQGRVKNKYCGKYNPPVMTSQNARMVITLNTSNSVHNGKFVARYKFITDYGVTGNQIKEGECRFSFKSKELITGDVISPRHPNKYPLNTVCEYIFLPQADEVIMIKFDAFVLSGKEETLCSSGDYIEFYEDVRTRREENYTLTEKHCGRQIPGPYATSKYLKIRFYSDNVGSYVGFKAKFRFVQKKILEGTCKPEVIDANGVGDIIISPNYPGKYPALARCEWTIHASKSMNRILVEFADVSTEGTFGTEGKKSNCPKAAIRLFGESNELRPMTTLCGMIKPGQGNSYMSRRDSFKISFVTSEDSHGGNGFKISWTEVNINTPSLDCSNGFQCTTAKYCISPSLKCNNEPNCGEGDNSDETAECPKTSGVHILHIAIGTSISSFFCIILLICGFYHRRKFRTDRAPPDHDHVEVRYVSAPTGCNTTDRLLMEDRNDNAGGENHNNSTTQSPRCQKVSMPKGQLQLKRRHQ